MQLLFVTTISNAADDAQLDVAGFSADGQYFVFEEYGVTADRARPYSNIMVLDTNTGLRVKRASSTLGAENALAKGGNSVFRQRQGLMEIRRRSWKYAVKYYSEYEIMKVFPPTNVPLFIRPVLVQEETGNRKLNAFFGPKVRSKALSKKGLSKEKQIVRRFELKLTTQNRASREEQEALGNCSPFTLWAELIDHKSGRTVYLADERVPPSWRRCIQRIDLIDVVVDRGRVAVLLSYDLPSYEGHSKRFMALTQKLP